MILFFYLKSLAGCSNSGRCTIKLLIADLALFPLKGRKNENHIVQTKMPKIYEDILVLEILTILGLEQRNNMVHFANTLQSSGRKKGSLSAQSCYVPPAA